MITMNTIIGFSILGIIILGIYVAIKAIDSDNRKFISAHIRKKLS